MKTSGIIFAVSMVLLFAGCGADKDVADKEKPVEKTFLDPQLKALEKAQGVEGMLQDADSARREALHKEGG